MIIHKMEQGTDEWHEVRKGKMTASHADAIATSKTGLDTYIYSVLSNMYSTGEVEHFSNKHIERGNELEPQARALYELQTENIVTEFGFIEHNKYSGCSPDGNVEESGKNEGMIEIKCKSDENHIKQLVLGEKAIESKYKWQMQMQMFVAEKKWCDFVCFNPNFTKSLYIFRIMRDEEKIEKIKAGLEKGERMIKEYVEKLNNL